MPIDYVRELVRLAAIAKPCEQPTKEDWRRIEAELEFVFPADFKSLVSQLGSGSFGCGLTLSNPRCSSDYARLSKASLIRHRAPIRDLEEKLAIPLYPSPRGVVLIAGMDRQDFYLKPHDSQVQRLAGLLWLNIDTEEITPINSSFPQFIHDLYLGLIPTKWASELRAFFWRNGQSPFFSPWPGVNP